MADHAPLWLSTLPLRKPFPSARGRSIAYVERASSHLRIDGGARMATLVALKAQYRWMLLQYAGLKRLRREVEQLSREHDRSQKVAVKQLTEPAFQSPADSEFAARLTVWPPWAASYSDLGKRERKTARTNFRLVR